MITILNPVALSAMKSPFGSLVSQISSAFVGLSHVETCLYNSTANPIMARKTCFVKQFAERRNFYACIRLRVRVNLETILRTRNLSCIECRVNEVMMKLSDFKDVLLFSNL
jgi:hypothetical protein